MSPKQWLALLLFFISYLFFGASILYHIEHNLETERRATALQDRIDINELLVKYTAPDDIEIQNEVLDRLSSYCSKPVTNYTLDTYTDPYIWSFFHAFWFSFITCSTVGYGNISPNNTLGRMFLIFYALIGIPVNGFLFAYLGDYFGKTFTRAYVRYKAYKISRTKNYVPRRLSLIVQIVLYLIPGVVIFIFLPACIFTYFEDWPYTVSVYYSFVTLSTIGFGDFVPTFQPQQEREFGIYFTFYQIFILVWFVFGLGYLVMIMGFIARGMRSKRLARLEHQLSENIKATQHRIWPGVSKDVGFLRRILNEVNLMKLKPVYTETGVTTYNKLPGSFSCPELTIYRSDPIDYIRKRTFSECLGRPADNQKVESNLTIHRIQSENDLSRIDKEKTFEGSDHLFKNADLIAKVLSALGGIHPTNEPYRPFKASHIEGGVHGFTDSQILSSERTGSGWSLTESETSEIPPKTLRKRAASDFHMPVTNVRNDEHEWTWSGNNSQIKEFLRLRRKQKKSRLNGYSDSLHKSVTKANWLKKPTSLDNSDHNNKSVILNIPPEENLASTNIRRSFLSRINPFKATINESKRTSLNEHDAGNIEHYLDRTSNGRDSNLSHTKPYLSRTENGRHSIFSVLSYQDMADADLLEKTTIGDLIRALEKMHTQGNAEPEQKSKRSSVSLSPPSVFPVVLSLSPPTYETPSRRGSLRPTSGYTTVFHSSQNNETNKQSANHHLPAASNPVSRGSSTRQSNSPTYQTIESPRSVRRRFSIRPANLTTPIGQVSSTQHQTALQRKLSLIRSNGLGYDNSDSNRSQQPTRRTHSNLRRPSTGTALETIYSPNAAK